MIDGLIYLKENGLEHDSLTCNNVLVDNNGQVRICRIFRVLPKMLSLTSFYRGPGVLSFHIG